MKIAQSSLNFRFDENSTKFSKWVENTVGKGEIACYEQFLLFPQCFQQACFPGASKGAIVWEWVNPLPDDKFYGLTLNPLPDEKILDWSKLKQFADDNFKFDENGTKFFNLENTVGKREIARYEQFFLFPQCFQQACLPGGRQKVSLCGNGLTTQFLFLMTLGRKPFENIVEKGENAVNQHLLLFPQCFLPNQ